MNDSALHFGRIPFVYFVMALLLGIMLAYVIPVSLLLYRLISILLFFGVFFFLGLSVISRQKNHRIFPILGLLFIYMLSLVAWVLTWKDHPSVNNRHFSRYSTTYLYGFIANQPKATSSFLLAEFRVTGAKENSGKVIAVNGKLLLRVKNTTNLSINYGDELVLKSAIEKILAPYNPNEFDYRAYLANKNIWHQQYLHADEWKKTGRTRGNHLVRYAFLARERMVNKFNRYFKNKDAKAIVSALVLGYRVDLDQTLIKAFSTTGTIHVLAVSGMHVGIVFLFLSIGLSWMNTKNLRVLRFMVLFVSIWIFALLTGFSASVLRAAIMISFVMIANTFSRQRNTANNIAASAFFLLLYNPKYLAEIGFQLSYLAVIGIIWIMPMLNKLWKFSNSMLNKIYNSILLSCSAQLTTFPLVLYYFHLFPVYFLPANLFIMIPVSIIIYVGFFLLMLPIHPISETIANYLEQFILLVNKGLLTIESLPGSTINRVWITLYQCLLIYLFMFFFIIACRYAHKKVLYLSIILFFILCVLYNCRFFTKQRTDQLIIFNMRKNLAIGLIHQYKAFIYSDLDISDKSIQYSVIPSVEANTDISKLKEIKSDKIFLYKDIHIREGTIEFKKHNLLIADGKKENLYRLNAPQWLLIRNNPQGRITEMIGNIKKEMLLILDGSNHEDTINRFCEEAGRIGIEVYVLKDNFAYVWNAY